MVTKVDVVLVCPASSCRMLSCWVLKLVFMIETAEVVSWNLVSNVSTVCAKLARAVVAVKVSKESGARVSCSWVEEDVRWVAEGG